MGGALSMNGTVDNVGEESRPQAALASVTIEDGKVTDKHIAMGQEALKELAGASGSGDATAGPNLTALTGLLGDLDAGEKMDGKAENPFADMDAMMGAMAAAETGVTNHTDGDPFAVVDAMLSAMEHAQSGNQNGTDNPFTAMGAMMGAMTDADTGDF